MEYLFIKRFYKTKKLHDEAHVQVYDGGRNNNKVKIGVETRMG